MHECNVLYVYTFTHFLLSRFPEYKPKQPASKYEALGHKYIQPRPIIVLPSSTTPHQPYQTDWMLWCSEYFTCKDGAWNKPWKATTFWDRKYQKLTHAVVCYYQNQWSEGNMLHVYYYRDIFINTFVFIILGSWRAVAVAFFFTNYSFLVWKLCSKGESRDEKGTFLFWLFCNIDIGTIIIMLVRHDPQVVISSSWTCICMAWNECWMCV